MPNPAERRMGADLSRLDPVEGMAQDLTPSNIAELQREIARQTDPEARKVLVDELRTILLNRDAIGKSGFEFRGLPGAGPHEQGSFEFKSLPGHVEAVPPTGPEPEPAGPFDTTPGDVTGFGEPPSPISPGVKRIGVELGASAAGATLGSFIPLPGAMRVGEAAGAVAGSLLSETFDPTESPASTALQAGAITLATGKASDALAGALRRAIGKPTAVGHEVVKLMEKTGDVPPASAVFDSGFVRDMQSIGSAAFGVGHRIENVAGTAINRASADLHAYVNSFQRYYDGARKAFSRFDDAMPNVRAVSVNRDTVEAAKDLINVWEREGLMHRASPVVQELKAVLDTPGVTNIRLSVSAAQELENMLFTRARELERSVKMGTVEAGGSSIISARYAEAYSLREAIDRTVDQMSKRGDIDPMAKRWLKAGREAWGTWKEGEMIETMVMKATKDLSGDELTSGAKLLSALDQVMRKEAGAAGGSARKMDLLSPEIANNVRRYANVLQAVEESGRDVGFRLAARRGQIVGITGLLSSATVGAGAGTAVGGPVGGVVGGAAAAALAPAALAYIFSSQKAMGLLLRGLKLDPGSAAFARTSRELTTLLVNEGVFPPEREYVEEPAGPAPVSTGGIPGVSGASVPNPTPSTIYPNSAAPRG